MSEITKDLKYYLNHPDEMPDDPKVLESLANDHVRLITGEAEQELTIDRFADKAEKDDKNSAPSDAEAKVVEDAKKAEEEKAAAEAKAKEEADKATVEAEKATADAAAEAKKVAEAKAAEEAAKAAPEGVLAKDGKTVIPFAVLTSARERAKAAESLAEKQAQEIERLKAEKAGKTTAQAEEAAVLSDEELAALAEDSPTLAKILKAQQGTITRLNEKINAVTTKTEQHEVEARTEAANAVQEAIDANPILAAWQVDEDQSRWNEAARMDRALRESPSWSGKSFNERFVKVVELTKAIFGEAVEPPKQDVKDVKVDKQPSPTEAEIKAAAEAKLAAKSKAALPVSLSQIPGGTPPAVDERERVEQMSVQELGSKLLGMTKEQQEAYLATL